MKQFLSCRISALSKIQMVESVNDMSGQELKEIGDRKVERAKIIQEDIDMWAALDGPPVDLPAPVQETSGGDDEEMSE